MLNSSIVKPFLWAFLAIVMMLPVSARANDAFSPQELDTLVATIALYPDPLLAQVLAASVHGDEIPGASDWANQHKSLKGQALSEAIANEDLPYDETVQALIPFPTVLATMAKYQVWTDQLGEAVSNQKEQVMDAVQRMRNSAYSHGHLQSNDQVKVIKEKTIIIEPVQKEYIYVPVYNPRVVYYVHSNGYPGLRYRYGVWIGGDYSYWGWGSTWFEWDTHVIYVHDNYWHHRHHPRHRYNQPRYSRPRNDQPAYYRPAKVPMSHDNAPRYSKTEVTNTAISDSKQLKTIRSTKPATSQDYYYEQNSQQSYGNTTATRSSQRSYGNTTATRSSQSSSRSNSSGRSSRSNSSSQSGFGKSLRK